MLLLLLLLLIGVVTFLLGSVVVDLAVGFVDHAVYCYCCPYCFCSCWFVVDCSNCQ